MKKFSGLMIFFLILGILGCFKIINSIIAYNVIIKELNPIYQIEGKGSVYFFHNFFMWFWAFITLPFLIGFIVLYKNAPNKV